MHFYREIKIAENPTLSTFVTQIAPRSQLCSKFENCLIHLNICTVYPPAGKLNSDFIAR